MLSFYIYSEEVTFFPPTNMKKGRRSAMEIAWKGIIRGHEGHSPRMVQGANGAKTGAKSCIERRAKDRNGMNRWKRWKSLSRRVRLGGRVVTPRGVPENASAKADPTECHNRPTSSAAMMPESHMPLWCASFFSKFDAFWGAATDGERRLFAIPHKRKDAEGEKEWEVPYLVLLSASLDHRGGSPIS